MPVPAMLRFHLSLASVLVAFAPNHGSAATPPAGGRPAANQVSLTVETAFTGRTAFEARGSPAGGSSVRQAGVRLAVPLPPVDQRWFPTASLRFRHHDLDRDAGTPLPDTLRSLALSLGVVGPLSPDWNLFANVSPGYANAGGSFTSRGFGVGVVAVATRKFAPDFSGGFGLRYDSLARGSRRVLPVATLDWTPAPAWRSFVGFPRTGASWRMSDAVTAELVAEMDFGSFAVTADPLPAGRTQPPLDRTRLEYQAVRVGPALAWRLSPAASLRLAAGLVPMLDTEYEKRGYKLKSADTPGFASAELEWRF